MCKALLDWIEMNVLGGRNGYPHFTDEKSASEGTEQRFMTIFSASLCLQSA